MPSAGLPNKGEEMQQVAYRYLGCKLEAAGYFDNMDSHLEWSEDVNRAHSLRKSNCYLIWMIFPLKTKLRRRGRRRISKGIYHRLIQVLHIIHHGLENARYQGSDQGSRYHLPKCYMQEWSRLHGSGLNTEHSRDVDQPLGQATTTAQPF